MSTSIEIRHDSAEIGSSGHEHRVAGSTILFESGRVGGSYTSGLGRVTGRNVWPDTTWTQLREMPGASAWTIIIRQKSLRSGVAPAKIIKPATPRPRRSILLQPRSSAVHIHRDSVSESVRFMFLPRSILRIVILSACCTLAARHHAARRLSLSAVCRQFHWHEMAMIYCPISYCRPTRTQKCSGRWRK